MLQIFDYGRLRKRIGEKFRAPEEFARVVGISPAVLAAKLNNNADFTRDEINKVRVFLEIHDEEITEFFFKKNKR
jgi:cyanate lyase